MAAAKPNMNIIYKRWSVLSLRDLELELDKLNHRIELYSDSVTVCDALIPIRAALIDFINRRRISEY